MDQLLRKKLKGPPFIRLPVEDYISCARLMKVNNEAIKILKTCISEDSSLWTEINILEKAVYKMKAKWRLEPLFRGTRQVLKCMKIMQSEKILEAISTALDSVLGLDGKTLVPSKQYLQYLLVKIIGVGKLAVQTIEYCMYTHSKLMGKIQIGHVLNSVMSFTAIISRIWMLSHTLLVEIRTCYESIYSLHLLATSADYAWLPENVTLPHRFPFHVDRLLQQNSGCKKTVLHTHSTQRAVSLSTNQSKLASSMAEKPSGKTTDVGVMISRDSFATSLAKVKQSKVKTSKGGKDGKIDTLTPKKSPVSEKIVSPADSPLKKGKSNIKDVRDSSAEKGVKGKAKTLANHKTKHKAKLDKTSKQKGDALRVPSIQDETRTLSVDTVHSNEMPKLKGKRKEKLGKTISSSGNVMEGIMKRNEVTLSMNVKKQKDCAPDIAVSKKLKRKLNKKELSNHRKFDGEVHRKKKKPKPH